MKPIIVGILQPIRNRLSDFKFNLATKNKAEKIYYLTGLGSLYSFIASLVVMAIFDEDFGYVFFAFSLGLFFGGSGLGFLVELIYIAISFLKNRFIQIILGMASIPAYLFAEVQANFVINQFTSVDPSYLDTASRAITILYVPWVCLVIAVVLSTLLIVVYQPGVIWQLVKTRDNSKLVIFMQRFVGILSLLLGCTFTLQLYSLNEESFMGAFIKKTILVTEYFPASHCQNISPHEQAAHLQRGLISVYDSKSGDFYTKTCDQ